MSLTIVLSGPGGEVDSVSRALGGAGFTVVRDESGNPHQKAHSFVVADDGETFVTVHGDDIEKAIEVAATCGWRLRSHWNTPEPSAVLALTPGERLAILESELAKLKASF